MRRDVHSLLVRSFAVPSACLGFYFAGGGMLGVLTAFSLRRSPPPSDLHVMSPTAVLLFGTLNALTGVFAIAAAIGLLLARSWGVSLWKAASIALALMAAANLVPFRLFGVRNVAFVAILLVLAVASHAIMRRRGAARSA